MFHIGQARMAILNEYFAKKYQSPQTLRFDDRDPVKTDHKCVPDLIEDVKTLGINIKNDSYMYSSDYFESMIATARDLMNKGKAYVDDTPKELRHKEILSGVESKCRNQSPKRNLELWYEMLKGSDLGQNCCLRGKIDMQHPNNLQGNLDTLTTRIICFTRMLVKALPLYFCLTPRISCWKRCV
ncbi:tyrosine--tRNA ligase [Ranunculus cassubicifolius]